jgi:hypothetical protein
MSEETMLEAVSAALGDAISPESETPEPDIEPVIETEVEGEPEVETEVEGEPEGEPEPEGEGEVGPEGERERNADGTWKKTTPKDEPKVEPEVKPEVKPKVEPPKKDPINDPIPENLKKDTSDRIRSLIDTAKSVTAERDQIKTDFDYLVHGVEATGTTPAQYGETLSWLSLFNSRDPAQQEKALELVESVAERLATLLGKERTVNDPLKAHVDLQEAVRTKQLTPEYAKEIARTRNGQTFRQELNTTATKEQQDQEAAAVELSTARAALSELEKTLQASDPSYAAKKAILVPALKPLFMKGQDGQYVVRPSQWKQKFTEAYRNIRIGAPAAKSKIPTNQPLRAGRQPAGGQSKQPGSMLEAISGALSGMDK